MDLHIHTCLSPCGDSTSVPTRIVEAALRKNLDAVAICDHNASENAASVSKAAEGTGLKVFGGMEMTTQSEIHLLGIFDTAEALSAMQETVYEHLPGVNDKEVFGPQYIVDHEDYVLGYNEHLLIGATDLGIEQIIESVHELGGLAIASHIDRSAFSILSQFGMIPEGLDLDAVEYSRTYKKSSFNLEEIAYPAVTSSDAHQPEQIGDAITEFWLEAPTLAEIKKAFLGSGGRRAVSAAG